MKTSCAILISHFESLEFLRCCIRQTRKHAHPEISQVIHIVDQSCDKTHNAIVAEYGNSMDIKIARTLPLYSGYGIDYLLRNENIDTEYICQLHVDCFSIHPNYLKLCISLIEEYNLSFVGQLHFVNYDSPVYPPHPFFSMSPTFNVARTETYKEMALEAGFTRFHNRPQSGLEFKNDDWSAWAKEDYDARGSDDDTVAFWWESANRNTDKVGLAISGFIEPQFGRIIDGIVFHFGSANEAKGVMDKMPELYQHYTKRINADYDDSLIDEMVALANKNKPPSMEILQRNFWDGTLKQHFPTSDEFNKRIEELKKQI